MPDTEKLTISLSPVDIGRVDVLIEQGFYSSRTDFARSAIRNKLEKHKFDIQMFVNLFASVVGITSYDRASLERYRAKRRKLRLHVVGALHLSDDISPKLASEVIESVRVRGIFQASDEVKAALADRIK